MSSDALVIHAAPLVDVADLYRELSQCVGDEHCLLTGTPHGFSGAELGEILVRLAPSAGGLAVVSRILVAWINAKQNRIVKINGIELRGYDAKEVERIVRRGKPGDVRKRSRTE